MGVGMGIGMGVSVGVGMGVGVGVDVDVGVGVGACPMEPCAPEQVHRYQQGYRVNAVTGSETTSFQRVKCDC